MSGSGCPHDIPAMKIASGNTSERYNDSDLSSGYIRYNTEENYLELYHSDNSNQSNWRDLVLNNKEQIDISGTLNCDGSLVIMGDISVNGQIFSSGGLVGGGGGGGGGSGTDVSFNVIDEFLDGSGVTFLTDVSINGDFKNSGFADLSSKVFLNTVTTTFNTGTIVDLSDVVTAMGTHLVAVDASFLNDVNVKGNLYVDGSFNFSEVVKNITTVDNELLISTQVDISNYGTGPALSVTQHGDGVGDNLVLLHAGTEGTAVEVKGDGKSIFYKDVDISGKLVLYEDISINGELIYGGFADISNKVFLNTVTTTFNTGTIVDLSDVVTAMSTQLTTHDASFQNNVDIGNNLTVAGNVGIGTTTPSQELDVDGNIRASGNVLSTPVLFKASHHTDPYLNKTLGTGVTFTTNHDWYNLNNNYSGTTGKFTASIAGIYAFYWGAFSNQNQASGSRPAFWRNNSAISIRGEVLGLGNSIYTTVKLEVGDYIQVKASYHSLYYLSHREYNEFSGHLVQAT